MQRSILGVFRGSLWFNAMWNIKAPQLGITKHNTEPKDLPCKKKLNMSNKTKIVTFLEEWV